MLVSSKNILNKARKDGYAVGAFNTSNIEITQAIIRKANEMNSPALITTTESAIKYMGLKNSHDLILNEAKNVKVPIALHLDHGKSLSTLNSCVKVGYTSLMIDASSYNFNKNIQITKKAVKLAGKIPVEAELGKLQGIEDNVAVLKKDAIFTNPLQAKEFMKKTKSFSLAVAIGTSHGAYKFKGESKLDIKRLKEISEQVLNPLVLHGASGVMKKYVDLAKKYGAKLKNAKGVSDSEIKKAIKHGISKVNIDTDLRLAFTSALRKSLKENPKDFNPRDYLSDAKKAVSDVVEYKIKLFGSENKA